MKRLSVFWITFATVLIAGLMTVWLAGCATVKTQIHDHYHNPDGSLNVHAILVDVSYGIEADCALGQTALAQDICTYGREAISAAQAISTSDPVLLQKSVAAILSQADHDHPQLQPYFEFALMLFGALV